VGASGAIDVCVVARDDERLDSVLLEMGRAVGIPPGPGFSGRTPLADDLTLADERLSHGAVIGIGGPVDDARARVPAGALELRVVGGPDAGRTIALDRGNHVVGRASDVLVRLDDPNV
jgi:DNA segregation ATPase FtsK/SpoIIIE, S-DNA-T family